MKHSGKKEPLSSSGAKMLRMRASEYKAYLWLLPAIILVTVFILIPIIETMFLSVSSVSRAGFTKGFIGFGNFRRVFAKPEFGRVMLNTLVWDIGIVAVSMILGFIMALVLNENFRGKTFLRTIVLLPWATSVLITASCWKYIFDYQYGALNALLLKLSIIKNNINFFATPAAAFTCMMFVGVVVTIPFITFTLLAGLQSISSDYYEAARIDGANFWQRLFKITVPMLKPAINISIVLNVIYVFNSFTIVHTITNGAPAHQTGTIMTWLYTTAFTTNDYGLSAAISVIGFLILLFFAIVYMRLMMKEED